MSLRQIFWAIALTTLGLGVVGAAVAALPAAAAELAADPYGVRLKLVWVCMAVGAIAYAVMIYGLVAARPVTGADLRSQARRGRVELFWAVIPAVTLIALAAPAVDRLASLAAKTGPGPAATTSVILR